MSPLWKLLKGSGDEGRGGGASLAGTDAGLSGGKSGRQNANVGTPLELDGVQRRQINEMQCSAIGLHSAMLTAITRWLTG